MTTSLQKEEKVHPTRNWNFLCYGCAVDSTMLTELSSISSAQAEPTKDIMVNIKIILDYAATHQDVVLTYHTSNMVLIIHSNALYLSEPKLVVEPEDIFSCHQTQKTQATTAPYSTLHSSPKQSCVQQPNRSLAHYT